VLSAVALLVAAAIAVSTRLSLQTGFEALLPEARPSVQELRRVAERTGGGSTLFVVLEGDDTTALRRSGDALVPALGALGAPWVAQAEDGVHDIVRYLSPRAGLFLPLSELTALRDDVEARFAWEVGQRAGTNLEVGPEDEPPPLDVTALKKRLGAGRLDEQRYPDGYYQSRDGKALVVVIRSGVLATDFTTGEEALRRVGEVVARTVSGEPSVRWGITGDLPLGVAEYRALHRDLTDVGVVGVALILSVVFLYFLRLRAVVAMTLTIGVGVALTFGLTELVLGHLNLATGFLFTIVAGNGINFAILFMARYLEERRRGEPLAQAVDVARRETWRPTLTAALAAAASYGSLVFTAFRGFREFGIIGAAGMGICWLATYLTLPPLLVVMERAAPLDAARGGLLGRFQRATRDGLPFGAPFAALVARAPRPVAAVGVLLGLAGGGLALRYARTDPMEYDLRAVQSDPRALAEEQRLIGLAKEITGYVGLDGMAILVDRVEQVGPLRAALEARRAAAPAGAKPFQATHALQDFVPEDQAAKIAVLRELAARLSRARRLGVVGDDTWARLAPFLPPADLRPFGLDDLPAALARGFTERDGTRGRMLYISPTEGERVSDARYLFRWADAFRRTELVDGSVVLGSGRAVIYADMWSAVLDDVPPAVGASFLATLLLVTVAFRGRRAAIAVALALILGASWTVGLLALAHARLNFLNFIALPITIGIGVDYAVNVVDRDLHTRDPLRVLRSTGGAVVLCSLTTLLGYLALVRSTNFAVRSLGVAAVIGEVACLLAAVLVLPAALLWWRSRRPAAWVAEVAEVTARGAG